MTGSPQPTVLLINNIKEVAASEEFGPFPVSLQMVGPMYRPVSVFSGHNLATTLPSSKIRKSCVP